MIRLISMSLMGLLMFLPAAHGEEDPLSDIVASKVEKIAGGFMFLEGPVWHKDGYLLFSDIPSNQIIKWLKKDTTEVWREPSGNSIGLTYDLQGRLIACEHSKRRISRTEKDGSITVIADRYEGERLNSPNDCVVRSDGTIFFTDPTYLTYGLKGEPSDLGFKGVYRVTPGEEPILLVKKGLYQPNAIAFSPDEKTLYVGDREGPRVRAFKVEDDDSLAGGEVIARTSFTDGMKVDVKGRLFVTSMYGIVVFDSSVLSYKLVHKKFLCFLGSDPRFWSR